MRSIGLFKWYNSDKGFGLIKSIEPLKKGCLEVFFHHSSWSDNLSTISIDKPLVFEIRKRKRGNGLEAINCMVFESTVENWRILFDNKDYNLIVDGRHGATNLMWACISMITTTQHASPFLQICTQWHQAHPESNGKDLVDYYFGGKQVTVPEYQFFLRSKSDVLFSQFSFERRKSWFNSKLVGLSAFSNDECIQMFEDIEKPQYDIIKESQPELYLRIIKEKILSLSRSFSFSYETPRDAYRLSKRKNEYDELQDLYADFILCANDGQIQDLMKEVGTFISDKYNEFEKKIDPIILAFDRYGSSHYYLDYSSGTNNPDNPFVSLKHILSLPGCVPLTVVNHLKHMIWHRTKDRFSISRNIELMSLDLIPKDYVYLQQILKSPKRDDIGLIASKESGFEPSFIASYLLTYLTKTGDLDSTLYYYNNRPDIQDCSITESLKSSIQSHYKDPKVSFINKATDYIPLFGEDFVFTIIKNYLVETHKSDALVKQLSHSDIKFKERILELLLTFHINHSECVDDLFIEPLCIESVLSSNSQPEDKLINEDDIIPIIEVYVSNTGRYGKAIDYAAMISSNAKCRIENFLLERLSKEDYVKLWVEGKFDNLPEGYLESLFDDNEDNYKIIDSLINNSRVALESIKDALKSTLIHISKIPDVKHFRTAYFAYSLIKEKHWEKDYESMIVPSWKDAFDWSLTPSPNFEYICDYFILFPESVQVKLFKFVFLCIAQKKLCINVVDLKRLNNCKPEFVNSSLTLRPAMCVSVSVMIESLCSFSESRCFLQDCDLFRIVYNLAVTGKKAISPIGDFFDKCGGKKKLSLPNPRIYDRYIYPTMGKESRKRWYMIKFNYDPDIIERVKSIPYCRYNSDHKIWFAPECSFADIEKFAKNNKFILYTRTVPRDFIEGDLVTLYKSLGFREYRKAAKHIADEFINVQDNMPGLSWCEGYESQNEDKVWWCVGDQPCDACSIKLHSQEEWQLYTLLDFCNILGLDVSYTNNHGFFKYGLYVPFISTINKFNQLLERLYCRECDRLLYPASDNNNNYSVSGSTYFQCNNSGCGEYHNLIYLNHCYTRKCRGVVDSRDEKRCNNGLVICSTCGTCCTTQLFESRLERLISSGSRDWLLIKGLKYKIDNDLGHINHVVKGKKDEFFCYGCGYQLSGNPENTKCTHCGKVIKYQTSLIKKS